MISQLTEYLRNHPCSSAPMISKSIGLSKKDINRLLYKYKNIFFHRFSESKYPKRPYWFLKTHIQTYEEVVIDDDNEEVVIDDDIEEVVIDDDNDDDIEEVVIDDDIEEVLIDDDIEEVLIDIEDKKLSYLKKIITIIKYQTVGIWLICMFFLKYYMDENEISFHNYNIFNLCQ
jgi:hypothetical protein